MKPTIIKLALTLSALTATQAHALVEAGHWAPSPFTGSVGDNFSVSVDQTAEGDFTGVFMNYVDGKLNGVTVNADEGAVMYVVKAGDVFTQASSASAANVFSNPPITVGTDFYLAAKTRSYTDPGFSYDDSFYSSFGWAHFKVDASGLPQLIDSAMAFREGGIIVGTLQAVPEPSTWAMMGVGLLALAWRSKSARQTKV
ncbi:MAG: hypothetical protein C0487_14790 [Leptothrix sp. (in: Bacteria)]|nr:hypothetical protein [Leptothrix sp. (in: b-proteobacteria)]